jgi:hypothetical protein
MEHLARSPLSVLVNLSACTGWPARRRTAARQDRCSCRVGLAPRGSSQVTKPENCSTSADEAMPSSPLPLKGEEQGRRDGTGRFEASPGLRCRREYHMDLCVAALAAGLPVVRTGRNCFRAKYICGLSQPLLSPGPSACTDEVTARQKDLTNSTGSWRRG